MRASVEAPFSWPMTQTERAAEASEAADDRLVLAELAVAGERREVADQLGAVVGEMRPLRMARDLRLLPRAEAGVEVLQRRRGLGLEPRHVVDDRDRVVALAERAQLLDLRLELGDRLFEIEVASHGAGARSWAGSSQGAGDRRSTVVREAGAGISTGLARDTRRVWRTMTGR